MELHAEHPTNPYPTCMHLFNASFFSTLPFNWSAAAQIPETATKGNVGNLILTTAADSTIKWMKKKEQQTNNGDVEAGKEIMNDRFE